MNDDRRMIRQISARTGLGLKFVSKDIFLSIALKGLQGFLDRNCVLKGGTAVSRAGYLQNPRFSEDADFDVFTKRSYKEVGERYYKLFKNLADFDVKKPRRQANGLRFDAYFENHFGEKDRIRIELILISSKTPSEEEAPKTLLQSQFTSGQACLLRTYSGPQLFVRKIAALSGRLDGKDAFDLWGMWSKGLAVDDIEEALESFADSRRSSRPEIVSEALRNVEKMFSNMRVVENAASHFIPRLERPNWSSLLADVRNILEKFADNND